MSSSNEKDNGGGGGPSSSGESEVKIKDEPELEDSAPAALMEVDGSLPPAFGPAALRLYPVGTKFPEKMTPTKPTQVLNARGMPARIRKKNKMFFDDELLINDQIPPKGSPRKGAAAAGAGTTTSATSSPQKGLVTPGKTLIRLINSV